ncbi:MAG TPA: BMP family ABC transporter substrate-binding protein [Acidimicrobiales bacterium]|nr:BMP family ABC transporter substrate-binding protein [Acidimicrobiales bacterium]
MARPARSDAFVAVGRRRRSDETRRVAVVSLLAFLAGVVPTGIASATPVAPRSGPGEVGHTGSFLACEVTGLGGIDGGLSDASVWAGLKEARKMVPSLKIRDLVSESASDYKRNIDAFIRAHCGIIITVGYSMGGVTRAAARSHPGREFAIVDYGYESTIGNVDSFLYETSQDAFLGGFLAAAMSRTGKVGTFGAERIPTVTSYMDGWVAGVCYFDRIDHKHVEVLGWTPQKNRPKGSYGGYGTFTGSFTNEADGRAEATTLMQQGADVIFPVTGSSGLGAAAEVKQYGHGVTMEWADTDGCVLARRYCRLFLTSVTEEVASSVETVVVAAAYGTFTGGNYIGDLANDGVTLTPFHSWAKAIPRRFQLDLARLKPLVVSGRVSVDPDSYPASCRR